MSDDFWANLSSYLDEEAPVKPVPTLAMAAGLPFDLKGIEYDAPPGFVGDLARYFDSQSRRPRRNLAVAGALSAIGNIAGLKYTDDIDGVTTNLFVFCVAGSRTGKESIQQCVADIHRLVGHGGATHGSIKSEQEIVRNLIRHQPSYYIVDEIGIMLRKIRNAQQKGGASYLDGIIGMLMAAYSKASSFMLLTGDAKEEVRGALLKEVAQINKRLDDGNGSAKDQDRLASAQTMVDNLDHGLEKPFLSLIGFTTPVTFEDSIDYESATNGFIGRALIFNERDTAPRSRKDFQRTTMPDAMRMRLTKICDAGSFGSQGSGRIEWYGDRIAIPTTPDAKEALGLALDWLEDQAVSQRDSGGLEALWLGAYELVSKVSLILGVADGERTLDHVKWAFAIVKRDIEDKIRRVVGNDRAKDAPSEALRAKIESLCGGSEGTAAGTLHNRLRGFKKEDVNRELERMVDDGLLIEDVSTHPRNGRETRKFRLAGGN